MTQTTDFDDTYPFQRHLSALARRSLVEFAHEVGYYQPVNVDRLSNDFYRLAMKVSNYSIFSHMEQLRMFFELEAAELLLCMPNNYWFWKAVYGGFVKAGVRGARKPIPLSCVAEGLAEVRRIYGSKYNLHLAVSDLSPSQVASRAVAGVLLVRARPSDLDEIVINPIFAPWPHPEGHAFMPADALAAALLNA